jgi:hypothetical protein
MLMSKIRWIDSFVSSPTQTICESSESVASPQQYRQPMMNHLVKSFAIDMSRCSVSLYLFNMSDPGHRSLQLRLPARYPTIGSLLLSYTNSAPWLDVKVFDAVLLSPEALDTIEEMVCYLPNCSAMDTLDTVEHGLLEPDRCGWGRRDLTDIKAWLDRCVVDGNRVSEVRRWGP